MLVNRTKDPLRVVIALHDQEIGVASGILRAVMRGRSVCRGSDILELREAAADGVVLSLQAIVDNTTAVIFVKDLELRYILVNCEYERRHQVRREQIRGKTDVAAGLVADS